MARPLLKKNGKAVLTRPPGIEGKIDIALTQDWATLARRARETNPQSGDFLPAECLVHLIRDAIHRGEDRIARVLMPQLLKSRRGQLSSAPCRTAGYAMPNPSRHEILSDLRDDVHARRHGRTRDELDFYECNFLRPLPLLRIDHVRKVCQRAKS